MNHDTIEDNSIYTSSFFNSTKRIIGNLHLYYNLIDPFKFNEEKVNIIFG